MGRTKGMDKSDDQKGQVRLMISGLLAAGRAQDGGTRIERGMPILSHEGCEVGKVAAVTLDGRDEIEYVLLSRLPAGAAYRMVPAGAIAAVNQGVVRLCLPEPAIEELAMWAVE